MKTTRNFLITGMVAAFCCSVASAQLIYSNSFNVTGLTGQQSINGVAPTYASDFAGGSSGAAWDVVTNNPSLGYKADQNGTLGAGRNSVLLPFTPQNGYVYTLEASLTLTTVPPAGGWGALGFAQYFLASNTSTNGGDRFDDAAVNGQPWALLNYASNGGGAVLFNTRGHVAGNTTGLIAATNTPYTIDLVLDTSAANWSTSLYVDSTLAASYIYTGGNPTLGAFGYGQTDTTAGAYQWNYITLTAQVPEPSMPALIGLGGAMLLLVTLYRSRRNAVGRTR